MPTIIESYMLPNGMQLLSMDEPLPMKPYNSYRIDGEVFKACIVYDCTDTIAIKDTRNFIGKKVEFIKT